MTRLPQPCLMLVTEPTPSLTGIVAEAVAGGVDVVQWRDRNLDRDTFNIVWEVREVTQERALMLVNGELGYSPYLVRKVGADGVQLPENSPYSANRIRHALAGGLAGRSVHSVTTAQVAAEEGADYLVAGTIFASQSHPEREPAGLEFLREVCVAVSIPVLAIGGVTPENVGACLQAGAAGVAVLSPIMRAADPKAAAQAYRKALDGGWEERSHPAASGDPPETGG